MLAFIVCTLVIFTTNVECSNGDAIPVPGGLLKLHKVVATWQQASAQCYNEGAVIASPLTTELRDAMQRAIQNNNQLPYFIGANSKFTPEQYVSVEGVPLANMPVAHMYQLLDTEYGECLGFDGYNITVVSCTRRLPYVCYKKEANCQSKCGTSDKAYEIDETTGSCYKVHEEIRTWLEALSICASEGGYLAIVNDEEEARVIANKIPDIRLNWILTKDWEPLFVGLHDWTGHNIWRSIHGHSMNQVFNTWESGEPSEGNQLCVGLTRNAKLDNIWCDSYPGYFICEREPAQ